MCFVVHMPTFLICKVHLDLSVLYMFRPSSQQGKRDPPVLGVVNLVNTG